MSFGTSFAHSYLLIGALVTIGAGLLLISLIFNMSVADSVRHEQRHREKLLEYYRNTFSQLGVILIGIGVSLFIFFFQQNYQDQRKRDGELQQALAKMALRIARSAAAVEYLGEFDEILDNGGPYVSPEKGGSNGALTAEGSALADQVAALRLVERDVDLQAFEGLNLSRDFEASSLINELDAELWFNMVRDESDINYAATQLAMDYKDLYEAIGGEALGSALADPEKARKIKHEVLDVFYDLDLLRQRSRRVLARACWLFSNGRHFIAQKPVDEIEANAGSHQAWLDRARGYLTALKSGNSNCYELLRYNYKFD